jgi:predicted MFS family arabinose efflux permease
MFFKPVVSAWIDMFGWRGAYVAVALLPILVAFPVAWVFFREEGPHPDRAARRAAAADAPGLTLAQTLRDWRFWLLCVALFVTAFAVGGPTPNMENILGSQGFAKGQVVTLTPLIGASVIVGRVMSGFLMDRVWAPLVAFLLLCLPAGACLLLGAPGLTYPAAFAAIGLIGVAAGMESDLVAFLVARYFGLKSYGAVYGLIYVCYAMGGAVAAGAFGWAYDKAGSYQGVLAVSAALLVMGAAAMLTLGRYRYAAAHAAERKGAA